MEMAHTSLTYACWLAYFFLKHRKWNRNSYNKGILKPQTNLILIVIITSGVYIQLNVSSTRKYDNVNINFVESIPWEQGPFFLGNLAMVIYRGFFFFFSSTRVKDIAINSYYEFACID